MLKTFLPKTVIEKTYILPLADKTSSDIKVVFEGQTERLKSDFAERLDKDYFEIKEFKTKELVENYLKSPSNFLSPETRKELQNKQYNRIFETSFSYLIEPVGIQISSPDKDPYLLLDNFLLSNRHEAPNEAAADKEYDFITLCIKSKEGLSPSLSNAKIKDLIKIQKELTGKNNKVYLAGSPIHSYFTSQKAILSINLICLLSTFLIAFLTYFYFRSLKPLIPIAFAIISGLLAGYISTKTVFETFQVLTVVFSTTLIGIGIDYSYHYFFTQKNDNRFYKNLTMSLVTTIVPFILLFFTGIELLKQISVFSVVGLITIYLVVVFVYPVFEKPEPVKSINIPQKPAKLLLFTVLLLAVAGFFRLNFNDSLTAFYTPSKKLIKAENLYNKVSGNNFNSTQFVVVKGKNFEDMIKSEEKITSELDKKNIKYSSLSSFIPSAQRQKENFLLVKSLYKENLRNYSNILSEKQIKSLMLKEFTPIEFNIEKYPYFKGFILDKNTSVIIVYSDEKLECPNVVNLKSDIKTYMQEYRIKLIKLFIPIVLTLLLILALTYGKKGLKMLFPPILGMFASVGITLLILGELNVFSIIALYMILGFTIDYSIFRTEREKKTEDAVLLSAITTTFSFLLLALCGFKLLSSISLVLFCGILVSYISGKILFTIKTSKD